MSMHSMTAMIFEILPEGMGNWRNRTAVTLLMQAATAKGREAGRHRFE